jgi:hypothetical protein
LPISATLGQPETSTQAAKVVTKLELDLERYESSGVRTRVIELTQIYKNFQNSLAESEKKTADAATAAADAEKQRQAAELAAKQAANDAAAKAAKDAADAAAKKASDQARAAAAERKLLQDQFRANRLMRLGVY